jgi:hypothetical protein
MDRALYSDYAGPLYQVTRASDSATDNIGLLSPGADVDAAQQDSFCAGTTCTVTEIYDQTSDANNLTRGPGGGAVGARTIPPTRRRCRSRSAGMSAYGLDIENHAGYRDDGPNNAGRHLVVGARIR